MRDTVAAAVNELTLPTMVADELRARSGTIGVTGASGWLGRATLELLERALGASFRDRVQAYASSAKSIELRSGTSVAAVPLAALPTSASDGMLLLHFAFLTKEQVMTLGADRYVAANSEISATVLDALGRCRSGGVLYASSGAAHADEGPYGSLKRDDEAAFAALGGRLAVPRIFAISGPYMNKPRQLALGELLLQALAGEPVTVRSAHHVYRSYAAPADIIAVSLAHLLATDGAPTLTFDSAGPAVEVGELATRIAAMFDVPVAPRPPHAGDDDRYVGSSEPYDTLLRALGREPRTLDQQIVDTADWLRSVSPPTPSTEGSPSPTAR